MKKYFYSTLLFVSLFVTSIAQPRFPAPEFESGYVVPITQTVHARALIFEYLDVAVLFALLCLMSWLVIKKRSRKAIIWTSIFAIVYFGFVRVGCVCSVGSIQNVCLSLFHADYVIPITVIGFFALPLLFTLLFGRTFCAGVCFMGAIQDLVNIKPKQLPRTLEKVLSTIPYIYLTFALIIASTGADFIMCRYDPFIGFFRLSASFGMLLFGAGILIIGIFYGRPYCRFLCPYGVILSWLSRIAIWHTTVTPAACIQCKLCDTSCPVNAIDKPITLKPESLDTGRKRLLTLLILLPLFTIMGGFVMSRLYKPLSTIHQTVHLAEEMKWETDQGKKTGSIESEAFHTSGISATQLFSDAGIIQTQFYWGTWIGGAFLGLMFGLALLKTAIVRRQTIYEPHRGNCVSCGRCYKFCPVEKEVKTLKNESKKDI